MPAERAEDYFEFLGKLGLTKHYGSLDATMELAEITGLQAGQLVLDAGCGVGATPIILARDLGLTVIGVDLVESMLQKAAAQADRSGELEKTTFLAADARTLPFPEDSFDAVLLESVNVFFEDKVSAFKEYARVIKPGGRLGITEMTWLRPPTRAYEEMFQRAAFVNALQAEEWIQLLKEAGFQDVKGAGHRIDPSRETKGRFQRYGLRNVFRTLPRIIKLLLTDRSSRDFFKDGSSNLSRDILDYVGYGVFAGKKI